MKNQPNLACVLIADDLTGACDAGVQFAKQGFSSKVLFAPISDSCHADVLIVSTDSRSDPPAEAGRKVRSLRRLVPEGQSPVLFKKIDSTFRGNVVAEVEAAMDSFGCALAVVAPSFPAIGRTVCGGIMRVSDCSGGALIDLPGSLRRQGMHDLAIIEHAGALGGCDLLTAFEVASETGTRLLLVDSESDDDLIRTAEAGFGLKANVLWVGSAGLASAVATVLATTQERSPAASTQRESRGGPEEPVLLCIGSSHPVTLQQKEYLLAHLPVEVLTVDGTNITRARSALRAKRHLVIAIQHGETTEFEVRDFFDALEALPIAGMLLAGGDTATLVCRALSVNAISLQGEIVAGIPYGRIVGGMVHGLPVVTKAGGFGEEDALVISADFLSRCSKA